VEAGRLRPAFFRFGSSLAPNGSTVSAAPQFSADLRGAAFVMEPLCLTAVGAAPTHSEKGLPNA